MATRPIHYGVSLLFHLLLLALLAVSVRNSPVATPKAGSAQTKPQVQPIQAKAVSAAEVQAEVQRLRTEQQQQRRQDTARRKRIKSEAARLAQLQRQREADEVKAEQLKKEQAALAQKNAAEQKRLERLAAQRKMAQEQARKTEQARIKQQAEQDLKKQLAAEAQRLQQEQQAAQAKANARYRAQYIAAISDRVKRNWLRPPDQNGDFTCTVLVQQMPTGDVLDVQITKSCGSPALDRSVQNAVRKSSPLPPPPVPEVFDREIQFKFSASSSS